MNARDQGQAVIEREESHTKGLLPVHLAVADYDRTRPLIDGRVKPEGVDLSVDPKWIGDFCVRPVYEQYDIAEFSLSWYVAARMRGEPVIAMPLFPLRMPVLAYLYVRDDSSFTSPRDLAGKRIGVPGYRYTVNLWTRGILKDHYGLSPDQVTWVTCGEEGAGYTIPKGIKFEKIDGADPEKLLAEGKVDALLLPTTPKAVIRAMPGIRRLFRDARAEMRSLVSRTGILPITHTFVMKQDLYDREPWLAKSFYDAVVEAQRLNDAFYDDDSKRLGLSEAVFFLEEERNIYGPNAWSQGLNPANRKVIETFVKYAHQQGYINRVPTL
ncbi:MAG: ABC transporter substrate-binding protein [Burkholderiales bacterium]